MMHLGFVRVTSDAPKTPSLLQHLLLILGTEVVWAVLQWDGIRKCL